MKGQSSAEMLILMGAILIVASSMLYLGIGNNELVVVVQAARDGAENAMAALDAEYGCSIDIDEVEFDAGMITIGVLVRDPPALENFDNMVKDEVRTSALGYILNAVGSEFPATVGPVKTSYYTYDVTVEVVRVTK